MSLTPKQARFVEEYLVDLNGTQAAIRAGYSAKTAQEQSSRLLSNVKVAAAVESAKAALSEKVGISQEWVIEKLKTVAERSMGETFNPAGANGALNLIGKHLGMFGDKLDVNLTGDLADRLLAGRQRVRTGA